MTTDPGALIRRIARVEARDLPAYNAGLSSDAVRQRFGLDTIARLGSMVRIGGSAAGRRIGSRRGLMGGGAFRILGRRLAMPRSRRFAMAGGTLVLFFL